VENVKEKLSKAHYPFLINNIVEIIFLDPRLLLGFHFSFIFNHFIEFINFLIVTNSKVKIAQDCCLPLLFLPKWVTWVLLVLYDDALFLTNMEV
jgi:hypothetical protein